MMNRNIALVGKARLGLSMLTALILAAGVVAASVPASSLAAETKSAKVGIRKPNNKSAKKKQNTTISPKRVAVRSASSRVQVPSVIRLPQADSDSSLGDASSLMHRPHLHSSIYHVEDALTGQVVMSRNDDRPAAIASITKLMVAYTLVSTGVDMDEKVVVDKSDLQHYKSGPRRIAPGEVFTRRQLLQMALMSSDNHAAHAIARTSPKGLDGFIDDMNRVARLMGMKDASFDDPSGLSPNNRASASDLAVLVKAAARHEMIRDLSTTEQAAIAPFNGRPRVFRTTNRLVRSGEMDIDLQKTGYTAAAGKCLVLYVRVESRPFVVVLMDSDNSSGRFADALAVNRVIQKNIHAFAMPKDPLAVGLSSSLTPSFMEVTSASSLK